MSQPPISASFSGSSSSGATQSGAKSFEGGGQFGSVTYGPGSVVNAQTPQPGLNWTAVLIVGGVIAGVFAWRQKA